MAARCVSVGRKAQEMDIALLSCSDMGVVSIKEQQNWPFCSKVGDSWQEKLQKPGEEVSGIHPS